jgi:hypothetical protein
MDMVNVEGGRRKAMADVQVGDRILAANSHGDFSYSDVVFLPHGYNDKITEFIEISTNMNNTVKFTEQHLVKTCSGALAVVGSLKSGACVKTVHGDALLTSINRVKSRGIYTVVTMDEFVVVDGIIASPFRYLFPLFCSPHDRLLIDSISAFIPVITTASSTPTTTSIAPCTSSSHRR